MSGDKGGMRAQLRMAWPHVAYPLIIVTPDGGLVVSSGSTLVSAAPAWVQHPCTHVSATDLRIVVHFTTALCARPSGEGCFRRLLRPPHHHRRGDASTTPIRTPLLPPPPPPHEDPAIQVAEVW